MDADDTTLTSAVKYDTDSEHEGTTNNYVRDLGLNLQPRLILTPKFSHRYVQTGW